jgi:hypothetical protein
VAGVGVEDSAHERVETFVPAGPFALAVRGVGRDQDDRAVGVKRLDLLRVPVAGVGENDVGWVLNARVPQFVKCLVNDRSELAEVGAG